LGFAFFLFVCWETNIIFEGIMRKKNGLNNKEIIIILLTLIIVTPVSVFNMLKALEKRIEHCININAIDCINKESPNLFKN
jgi:hypothetical protein